MGSSAQLTTQTKIVSRLNFNGSRTFDLRDNGTLLVLNFVRDSLSDYSLPDFYVKRGTYLVRLDNNFDTLWTKVIYNLHTTDCILNKDNKIILVGKKYAFNGQLQCGLDLLKLDLNGNQIKSVYYNNDPYLCSFNNTSYYYETLNANAYINEYRDNAYIVFYIGFLKFNDNLDLVDKKFYPNIVANYSFREGNNLLNLDDSTLVTSVYCPNAFPGNPFISNNAILKIDTQLTVKNYFKVDNPFTFILSLSKCNNSILFNGKTQNSPTGSINGLNFLGSVDLNTFNGNGKKRILRYRPDYLVLSSTGSSSICKVKNNRLYSLVDLGSYSSINDSTGFNNRRYLYCFDTGLNIIWGKRLHLFNSFDTLPTGTYNSISYISTSKKDDFIFKADKIILSNYDYQEVYNAGPYFNRSNFGFNLSSIDTNGNNALCNATIFNSYLMEDSLGFLNLPIPVAANNVFPQFIPNTVSIENFLPQQIAQKCLPVKPPVSKFVIALPVGQATCINTNIPIYEYSYNEPRTWQWIFPPEADTSGINPLYLPFVQFVKFTQAGVFPIKLVTTNDAGTDTMTQYITVINFIPQPHLGNDTTICSGDSVRIIYHDPPYSAHYFSGPNIFTTSDTLVIRDSGQYIIAAYTVCGYLYDTINVHVVFKPRA